MTKKSKINPPWEEIFLSLGDGLIILDPSQLIVGMNPAAERLVGASAETVLGASLSEAFPENNELMGQIGKACEATGVMTLREVNWQNRQREKLILDLSTTPLLSDQGELQGWILLLRDLTPIKVLEEDMRKADRLAMMGTIAAGLAHEIKNPLGGIRGAAQLVLRSPLTNDDRDCLDIVVKEVDRIDRILTQLLSFTKPKTQEFEPVLLNELLDHILKSLDAVIRKKKVKILLEYDPSLPPVLGHREELHQVFLNFFKNAIEAGATELKVKTRIVTDYRVRGQSSTRSIRMMATDIVDNGKGISEDDQKNIFTPFFTTKEKGYGLGLALSQRVITEHGGQIHVKSEIGKGTQFQIILRGSV